MNTYTFWQKLGLVFAVLLITLNLNYSTQAQQEVWDFWFSANAFPTPNYGCPYLSCSQTNIIAPQTIVSYGSNGTTVISQSLVKNNQDKNFTATFSGGRLMGGMYTYQACTGGTSGYGKINSNSTGEQCAIPNTPVEILFSEPVQGSQLTIFGKYPQDIIVTESGQFPRTYPMELNYLYPSPSNQGTVIVPLSGKPITRIKIQSFDPKFAFAVNGLKVYRTADKSPNALNPPPNYCSATAIARPAPENASKHGWTMHAEVSDDDGLVLTDVKLNGRMMAEKISVPYYMLATKTSLPQRGELRPSDTSGDLRSKLVNYSVDRDNNERLIIKASYAIDNIANSTDCLFIDQQYEFTKENLNSPCEPGQSFDCSSFRAAVSYNYKATNPSQEDIRYLDIAQRNKYAVNSFRDNTVGLFLDCDEGIVNCLVFTGAAVFNNKKNPLMFEGSWTPIRNGENMKEWDNIHQTFMTRVSEPFENLLNPETPLKGGGCPECVHTHWRWGTKVPNPDHFGNGKLFLPQGSNQKLVFAIVKDNAGEEDPTDFISLENGESLRRNLSNVSVQEYLNRTNTNSFMLPLETVTWYQATGYKNSDTFFDFYSFFNPSSWSSIIKPIILASEGSANNFIKNGNKTLQTDAPTSVMFAYLYKDADVKYKEIPATNIPPLPNGYTVYNSVAYNILSDAVASGPNTINFNLPSVTNQTIFNRLRILHAEIDAFDSSKVVWVDRTILSPGTPSPDFTNRNISAVTPELGIFLIADYTPPATIANTADLSVIISDSTDPISAGSQLTYTINVTNNGSDPATNVILNDSLSADTLFVSATPQQGECRAEDGEVMCKLGSIASGSTVSVSVVAAPYEGQNRFPTAGKLVPNTAFVKADEIDNNQNNNSANITTNILPNPNAPPTVKIQSPAFDTTFSAADNLTVLINATDPDGTVAQVELFDGETSLGNAVFLETGKYTENLTGLAVGEHLLTAIVTDNGGRKAVSDSVKVIVNGPAIVSLVSPVESDVYGLAPNLTLSAKTLNSAGTIGQVEFTANGISIGNGVLTGTDQYDLTWNAASIGAGIISLRAIATDGNGAKSYSDIVKVYVTSSPTINIMSPADGTSIAQNTYTSFMVDAKDSDGYISKVEFYNGETYMGQADLVQGNTFKFKYYAAPLGNKVITAVATDSWGKKTTSSPINITVTNTLPSVSITAPAGGATYTAPASIQISATAADTDGYINKIELYRGTTRLTTVNNSDVADYTWNNVAPGSYSLTAKVTDNDGGVTTSAPVTVTVNPVGTALFVVGNTTLSSVDAAIRTRLQNLGFTVTVKSATSATTADATGKSLVVVSDSVTPTNVTTKYKTVAVPVMMLDPQLFDDMGMTATAAGNFGTTATQKNVTISNAAHPMASGLTGTVQVTSADTSFGWGVVNANALKIATLTADTTKATDFGYTSGAVMPGLKAPARRVGFFYTASSTTLTSNGGLLFDNAVKWAAGL